MVQAIPRTFILSVTDAANHKVIEYKQPKAKQVIKADTAYIVTNMASDPNASYLPGSCTATTCTPLSRGGYKFHRYNGWDFAVKTGTTNYAFDGLMTSWSTKYAVVSWVGNHTRNVALTGPAEVLTAPLTRGWMEYAHTDQKPVNWTAPSTIKTAPAFVVRSKISRNGEVVPSPSTDIYPGNYVGNTQTKSTSQTLDKVSGKLATSCTPASAKEVQTNSNVAFWNADIFSGGRNSITSNSASASTVSTPTDDVHNCNDSPPVISLTAPNDCNTSCTITATITQGTHPLSDAQYPQFPGTVTFTLGGNQLYSTTVSTSPSTVSFPYTPTASGSGSITATVTDSVLYSATASANITFEPAPTIAPLANLTTTLNGTLITVSWTGGSGPYTVSKENGDLLCSKDSGTSCTYTVVNGPKNTKIVLRDNSGQSLSGKVDY